MKFFSILFLLGWFYVIQSEFDGVPGAKVITVSGPFVSKSVCEDQLESVQERFALFGITAEFSECTERTEA